MKQENLSILFFILKNRLKKNGEAPILLRVTLDGNYEEIRVQRSIPVELWNQDKGCSKGKDKVSLSLNAYIKDLEMKLRDIHKQLVLEGAYFTPALLLQKLFNQEDKKTLLAMYKQHIEECRQLIGKDYEAVTINRYDNCYRKLAAMIQKEYGKNDISFYELDGIFIRKFELYLKIESNMCQNTIVRYMKAFKKFTTIAVANKWLKDDPFFGIKYKQVETSPTFLTIEEVEAIAKKEFAIERLNIVKDAFIFCCYTGLAFMDAQELKPEHLLKDNSGNLWIRKPRVKLEKRFSSKCVSNVPLVGMAKRILEKYKSHPICLRKDVCLPMYSNQKMNSYLKEIADLCGVKKHLTTHVARHTNNSFRLKTSTLQEYFF